MIFLGILTKNIGTYGFPKKSYKFPDPISFQFSISDSKFLIKINVQIFNTHHSLFFRAAPNISPREAPASDDPYC